MEPDQLQALLALFQNFQGVLGNQNGINDYLVNNNTPTISTEPNGLPFNPDVSLLTPPAGLPTVVQDIANQVQGTTQLPVDTTFSLDNLVGESTRTIESLLPDLSPGEVFSYQGNQYKRTANGYEPFNGTTNNSNNTAKTTNSGIGNLFGMPYGTDLTNEFYNLGNFLGMDSGTQGRNLGIASSGLSAGLGALRTGLAGYANAQQTGRVRESAREQMQKVKYTPQTQYKNTNNLGGFSN